MNAKENMHEVRFSNICILSHIIHYIHPLTMITALAIKAVDFLHYDNIMVISKIKFDFF